MKTVVDTSALIAFLRGEEPGSSARELLNAGHALVPAICVYELYAGVHSKRHREQRAHLVDLSTVIPIDGRIAERAATLFNTARSSGFTVDNEDLLIAATAIEMNVPVLTANRRHFERIDGVELAE